MLYLMTLQVRSTTKCATTSRAGRTCIFSAVFSVRQVCVHGQSRLGRSRHSRVRKPGKGPGIGIGIGPDIGYGIGGDDGLDTVITQDSVVMHPLSCIGISQRVNAMVRRHIIPTAYDVVNALAVDGVNSRGLSETLKAILKYGSVW